jgi:hypothetical protein
MGSFDLTTQRIRDNLTLNLYHVFIGEYFSGNSLYFQTYSGSELEIRGNYIWMIETQKAKKYRETLLLKSRNNFTREYVLSLNYT